MYTVQGGQYTTSDGGAQNRIENIKLLKFADIYGEMNHKVIDTQMVHLGPEKVILPLAIYCTLYNLQSIPITAITADIEFQPIGTIHNAD